MENRYKKELRKANQFIIDLNPAHPFLRLILALECKKKYRSGDRILELGCGEGDSAKPILEHVDAKMDLVDISPKMIQEAKKRLAIFSELQFFCADIINFLETNNRYNIITASWTVHNFTWEYKRKLFRLLSERLEKDGVCILMDKIYPEEKKKELLEQQLRRYEYLSPDVKKHISKHENQDFQEEFRMDEIQAIQELKNASFRQVYIVDRVERDVVLIAEK